MQTFINITGIVRATDLPELRYTPNKKAVVTLLVASNSSYQTQDGTKVEESCFIKCSGFGSLAEAVNKYVKKGDPVYIEGQLKLDTWNDSDGKKQSRHTVKLDKVTFLKAKE